MSMTENESKFVIINVCVDSDARQDLFVNNLNDAYERGYDLSKFIVEGKNHIALMRLRTTPDLSRGRDFVNIDLDKNMEDGSPLIAKMLREGWTTIANYSKHVTLMKVGLDEQGDRGVDEGTVE